MALVYATKQLGSFKVSFNFNVLNWLICACYICLTLALWPISREVYSGPPKCVILTDHSHLTSVNICKYIRPIVKKPITARFNGSNTKYSLIFIKTHGQNSPCSTPDAVVSCLPHLCCWRYSFGLDLILAIFYTVSNINFDFIYLNAFFFLNKSFMMHMSWKDQNINH